MGRKLTTQEFIVKAKETHGDRYEYSSCIYESTYKKVVITCKKHGDFEQIPNSHITGKGCAKCGVESKNKKSTPSTEETIGKFIKVHGDKYDYSKYIHTSTSTKGVVICREHGDFKQTPKNHLGGQGCPKCTRKYGWSRSEYVEKAKERLCTFYTIRCFNEHEEFFKVGITMEGTKKRYKTKRRMPYAYEIISEVKGEAGFIWDLEVQEKRKLKDFKYQPKIKFDGSKTECFTQYKI